MSPTGTQEARPDAPASDCPICPRLTAFRHRNQEIFPSFHNAPVDSFGPLDARLLIVGLAPGLKGANQTGRPFTGDYAGDLLYATLKKFGFAVGRFGNNADDGLELRDCRITNAVRCVPPENKPVRRSRLRRASRSRRSRRSSSAWRRASCLTKSQRD